MDSVMDFVNISAIHHATQERQSSHYQTIKDFKRGNVRDVRDKKGKKLGSSFPLILNAWNEKHWLKPELLEQPELLQVIKRRHFKKAEKQTVNY